MKYLKLSILFLLSLFLVTPILATKSAVATVTGKGYVNGKDIDSAQNRATAIHITNPQASFRGEVTNNTGNTINLSRVTAEVTLFDKEYSFLETVSPGETKSKTISASIPSWIFSAFKGYYSVTATVYDDANNPVLIKNFMVFLGKGSPLASVPGAVGVASAAVAVTTGVGVIRGAKPPKPTRGRGDNKPRRSRNGLRSISTIAMIMAVLLLFMMFGLINLSVGLAGFLAFGAAAGISWNLLIQLFLAFFGA